MTRPKDRRPPEPRSKEARWKQFLAANARIGVVATTAKDGTPHAVPVDILYTEGVVHIWCQRRSEKAKHVLRDRRAAVVAYRGNSGVLVQGPATVISSHDAAYESITTRFREKFSGLRGFDEYQNDALIRVDIERVSMFGDRVLKARAAIA